MKPSEQNEALFHFPIYIALFICVAMLSGCKNNQPSEPVRRLIIVLIDESDSFALYKERGVVDVMYWPEVIPLVIQVVNRLESGDEFAVIGIDEQGFEEEDVRIAFEVLDEGFLKAKMQKDKWLRKVMQLERRKEKHRSTDILGALSHVAHFALKEPDRRTVIFCFSDMKQEPRWPTEEESRNLRFPNSAEGYFFYVNASGRNNWNTIINVWEQILSRAGLQIYTDNSLNFFQRGESNLRLKRILDAMADR